MRTCTGQGIYRLNKDSVLAVSVLLLVTFELSIIDLVGGPFTDETLRLLSLNDYINLLIILLVKVALELRC